VSRLATKATHTYRVIEKSGVLYVKKVLGRIRGEIFEIMKFMPTEKYEQEHYTFAEHRVEVGHLVTNVAYYPGHQHVDLFRFTFFFFNPYHHPPHP
jgi:hypothetical protein